jgi:hypothetical protein
MGLFDKLLSGGGTQGGTPSWLNRNSDMLLQIGLGGIAGRNAQEQAADMGQGLIQGMRTNRTAKWLEQNDPELAKAFQSGMLDAGDALKLSLARKTAAEEAKRPNRQWVQLANGQFGWADKTSGTFLPLGTAAAAKKDDRTALIQEFEYARDNGFEGSILDFSKAKSASSANGGGYKPPPGYRVLDPNNPEGGLEPIPGGPAEEIPGELAARLGMTKNFLQRAPEIRKRLAKGEATGWLDQRFALNGVGERGQLYQDLQSGTDALTRLLTGAGMNESEARAYTQRYLPTGTDTAETAVSKLDRLTSELQSTAEQAGKGRGGFKFGNGANNGSTSNRIRWSVK